MEPKSLDVDLENLTTFFKTLIFQYPYESKNVRKARKTKKKKN